jgi:hypothetical protein
LKKKFHYELGGTVWRVVPDVFSGLLAIELRYENHEKIHLLSLNTFSGDILCEDIPLPDANIPEKEWGIEAAHKGILYLFRYANVENMPHHQGIWAIDMADGAVLWQKPHLSLKGFTHEQTLVLADNSQPDNLVEIPYAVSKFSIPEKCEWLMPTHYSFGAAYTQMLQQFVQQKTTHAPLDVFDYLEYHEFIFVSYYIRVSNGNATTLDNYFVALDADGHVLLHLRIAHSLTGAGLDTFFVFNQQLFLIIDKTELLSYELTQLF